MPGLVDVVFRSRIDDARRRPHGVGDRSTSRSVRCVAPYPSPHSPADALTLAYLDSPVRCSGLDEISSWSTWLSNQSAFAGFGQLGRETMESELSAQRTEPTRHRWRRQRDELTDRSISSSRAASPNFMHVTGTPASCISLIVSRSSSESRACRHLPTENSVHCSPIRRMLQ
jgi:hypothetical protein